MTPTKERGRPLDFDDVGTVPSGINVTNEGEGAGECGTGVIRQTVLEFTADQAVTMTDEAGVVLYGGLKIYDFPAGDITILAAVADLDIEGTGNVTATFDGDVGIGTATAGNNNALAGTEQDILPTTATPQAVASLTTANGRSTAISKHDGTSTAIKAYLNFLVDDADHNGGGITVKSGSKIYLTWFVGGDY